jgi:hypothetical protein
MVKKPLNVTCRFDVIAKRVGEVCALSSAQWSGHAVLRTSILEATVTEGDSVDQRSGNTEVAGSVVALLPRASKRGAPAVSGDDDATMLALQLCEQVREYRRPQRKGAGANVVWLFR